MRCFRGEERTGEDTRGCKRKQEDWRGKTEREKRKKKEEKMEFYNEYEPHGEVEECTWQVWGQKEEEREKSYK